MAGLELIEPDWPRHPRVRAAVTTRAGGISRGPYASLNLAMHVGDDPRHVAANRERFRAALALPAEPAWLDQVHGTEVLRVGEGYVGARADASWTDQAATPLAILTADCLPVLLADDTGHCVAAAHAGWRGLAAGVLERTVQQLPAAPSALSAWLGPAIGPDAFEVGPEVREAFVQVDDTARDAFTPGLGDRLLCDLYRVAQQRLRRAGVSRVYGGGHCTHAERDRFYSFRRDGVCGRMATLVWLA